MKLAGRIFRSVRSGSGCWAGCGGGMDQWRRGALLAATPSDLGPRRSSRLRRRSMLRPADEHVNAPCRIPFCTLPQCRARFFSPQPTAETIQFINFTRVHDLLHWNYYFFISSRLVLKKQKFSDKTLGIFIRIGDLILFGSFCNSSRKFQRCYSFFFLEAY